LLSKEATKFSLKYNSLAYGRSLKRPKQDGCLVGLEVHIAVQESERMIGCLGLVMTSRLEPCRDIDGHVVGGYAAQGHRYISAV